MLIYEKLVHQKEDGTTIDMVRYTNPDGSKGGWIAPDQIVPEGVYIDNLTIVHPGANIRPGQKITDIIFSNKLT